ncbi:hypothetical protein KDN24_06590 [Bacillus sp. Bva_UNVM-123]|uniref:hypothetical protein n=1 Tax=Bacillus sp. Bva_UNVM-123 TaxID=2829798 RepID=UPI00391EF22C
MDKQYLKSAEAIKLLNQGKVIYYDTTDGYTSMKKKSGGKYEIKVFTDGVNEAKVFNGNMQNVLITINKRFKDKCYLR